MFYIDVLNVISRGMLVELCQICYGFCVHTAISMHSANVAKYSSHHYIGVLLTEFHQFYNVIHYISSPRLMTHTDTLNIILI